MIFLLFKIELFGRSIRGLSRGYSQGSSWDDGEDGEDGSEDRKVGAHSSC